MSVNKDENEFFKSKKGVAMNLRYTGVPTSDYDNGRDEKPWQRVAYTLTKKGKHLYEPVKSVPSTFILVLLGGYLLLGYMAQLIEDDMPRVVTEDLMRNSTTTFSEEAAWVYLREIVGDGPRVAGTAYHLAKTRDMKAIVDRIASGAVQPVHTDWQIVSGDYFREGNPSFVNFYENASNIIALLEGESGLHSNGTIGSSILVNCHYDSVPYAQGASDDALFCAAMAETLSLLSKRTQKLKHNIIFLFNGAEENGLQASHGFLKHPWAKGVTAVVNLEAAGMNGKPTIFQVSDPRLLTAYKRTTYRPNAQGLGEFLFASGIIPSDTDFRIFRDFGDIHGIDIAFTKWGQVYHTRYDNADLILPGVMQNAGNMVLGLVAELADMDELSQKAEPTAAVYYDYLNLFLVTYSLSASYAVDALIATLALVSVAYYVWLVGPRWSSVQELCFAVLSRVAAALAGVLLAAVFMPIMVATTVQLRYLSEPWLVVAVYWMPYLVGAVAASHAFDAWRTKKSGLNRSIRSLQAMAATRLTLAAVLLVLMCVPAMVTTRYLFSAPLFIMSLMSLLSLTVVRYVRLRAWQHLLLEAVLSVPSVLFMFALALRLDAMMLPIMGRSSNNYPDYTVGVLNIALAWLVSCTVSGIEILFSRRRLWLALSAAGAVCVVLMFVPFSPYRDDGPATQRHYWFHTETTTYDRNLTPTEVTTGIVAYKLDTNTIPYLQPTLVSSGVRLPGARSPWCATRVFCDLPLYRASFAKFLPEALLLYKEGPKPFSPPPSLAVTHACVGELCTYRFVMIGPHHNTITIWPHENVNLTAWSLDSPVGVSFDQLGRPVYTILHSLATFSDEVQPLEMTMDFIVPLALQSQPAMDVSHHAFKIHHPEEFTEGYRALLDAVPKYYNVATWLTFRHNYVF